MATDDVPGHGLRSPKWNSYIIIAVKNAVINGAYHILINYQHSSQLLHMYKKGHCRNCVCVKQREDVLTVPLVIICVYKHILNDLYDGDVLLNYNEPINLIDFHKGLPDFSCRKCTLQIENISPPLPLPSIQSRGSVHDPCILIQSLN